MALVRRRCILQIKHQTKEHSSEKEFYAKYKKYFIKGVHVSNIRGKIKPLMKKHCLHHKNRFSVNQWCGVCTHHQVCPWQYCQWGVSLITPSSLLNLLGCGLPTHWVQDSTAFRLQVFSKLPGLIQGQHVSWSMDDRCPGLPIIQFFQI